MKYKIILWDIDGTLLSFKAAESVAIKKGFERLGFGECTDEMLSVYSSINRKWWNKLERKECTKPEVLIGRFLEWFALYNLDLSKAEEFNSHYQVDLGDTIVFNDEADQIVKAISIPQYGATNGTKIAQDKKIKLSHLDEVLQGVFISDVIGHEKPTIEFFDFAFDVIEKNHGKINKDEIVIIGDSLTSDIQGGNNAGIATIWYNKDHLPNNTNLRIDFEIDDLRKVMEILK